MAKLTDAKVRDIRNMYATGRYSQQELADSFDICQSHVSALVKGKRWSHN